MNVLKLFAFIKDSTNKASRYLSYIGMFFLLPMMFITSCDVITKAIFSWPFPGSNELSGFMLSIFILSGLPYTQQIKGHAEVKFFISKLKGKAAATLDLLATLLCLIIIILLCWQGFVTALNESTVSDALRIPHWPFKIFVAIAGFLVCLELIIHLTCCLARIFRKQL